MNKAKTLPAIILSAILPALNSCTTNYGDDIFNDYPGTGGMMGPGMGGMGGSVSDDGSAPDIDNTIYPWDGTKASDAGNDTPGSDNDIYHEAVTFNKKVTVTYSDRDASVVTSDNEISYRTDGAYVTIDFATAGLSGVEIELKGSTSDGGLKVYGGKKYKLTLNGVSITSQRGPAINNQCKKILFVHVADGTNNYLTDVATYTDDPYYLDPTQSEDRKGCLFSEGSIVMSGTGVLSVAGKYKHAVVTDKLFTMRPGANLVITEAAKNGLHVKGDSDSGRGVSILGGYIYANISASAGKAIKTDLNFEISGGVLDLNTSGNAIYDEDDKDTSSAAGIKTDGSIIIKGGTISAKSTGSGGKGLNSDSEIIISGGQTSVATCGDKYTYSRLSSSPKGVKADGNITISGGELKIATTGRNDGAEGLESKAEMNISGGNVQVYAYDDAINAATAINISGGVVSAYSRNNDGIDSNGTLTISGGTVLGSSTSSPECGIDTDSSNGFKINGGNVFAVGGSLQSLPSTASAQYCVSATGVTATKGATITVTDASSNRITSFEMPRSISGASIFISSSGFKANTQYTVSANNQSLFTFTTSSKIVSVGSGR